ncbi:hypothetical protein EUZ85_15885 [Hahella sp. KA22]|uniref:Uncharacterized protein n=1 Tax=Hahella chejuensis (strain KCTC 2396) TaxID=349521 RepID=Q2SFM6_HAHCH|nr:MULTISPECIES: hypothetical protein [Hahella]ABC30548.1 hypothetical protein HCH_03816 [Hahella chejuensis KCTC 2396]AZZ92126.1 hypothetical protein ENC22_13320 [Hahella sp. KA22]QAY55497.1 hypothetical protein EUZ85_15885 [Hahella sp. KA22]
MRKEYIKSIDNEIIEIYEDGRKDSNDKVSSSVKGKFRPTESRLKKLSETTEKVLYEKGKKDF